MLWLKIAKVVYASLKLLGFKTLEKMLALMGYLGMFVLNGQMNYTAFDFEDDIVTVEDSPCNIYIVFLYEELKKM